eukprot:Plantae.Rhodophyta-Hildenbrandia_rubra.ctg331.p1 GENE.Plantae.Rhodophyta-Hildenbrandia_rubra.ctg331~~Plantae.Rhodophyta-Hildenbrandia_rubra.ctg331.p1  ORF type:complete len:363 (-),score=19.37 Plantae.Rhodophyta-Hildenbrandia_rubra.ctg331:3292-4380(-)
MRSFGACERIKHCFPIVVPNTSSKALFHSISCTTNHTDLSPDTLHYPSPMTLGASCNVSPTSIHPYHNESIFPNGCELSPLALSSNRCINRQSSAPRDVVVAWKARGGECSRLQDSYSAAHRTIVKPSSTRKCNRLPSFKEFVKGAKIRGSQWDAKFIGEVTGGNTGFVSGKKLLAGNVEVSFHNVDSFSLSNSPALKTFGRQTLLDSQFGSPVGICTTSVAVKVESRTLSLGHSSHRRVADVGEILSREKDLAQPVVSGEVNRAKYDRKYSRKQKMLNYPCFHCTHVAKQKADLNRHVNAVYLQLRPFECRYCSRLFRQKSHLRNHEQQLHGTPKARVKCEYCELTYSMKSSMRRHKRDKH